MKTLFPNRLLLAAALLLAAISFLHAGDEQELIALLQSNGSATQKSDACLKLRVVGTAKAIPALAALLSQDATSHAARHALEGIPGPEAVAALRQALHTTSGLTQAGVLESLGWRRDTEAVSLLASLLSNNDPVVAAAAATALGRIGSKDAAQALTQALGKAAPALLNGALLCAETLLAAGDAPAATALYRKLSAPDMPPQVRAAAWRGTLLADPSQRATLMLAALTGPDRPLHLAALKVIRELEDKDLIEACLRQWAQLPAAAAVAVLEAHVPFGAAARPTLQQAAQSPDLTVRLAAWQALVRVENPAAIPALAQAAAQGETDERAAARAALASMPGSSVHAALLQHLDVAADAEKAELLRALGDRRAAAAADTLLRCAASSSAPVRRAALESLRKIAAPSTLIPLLNLAAQAASEDAAEPVLRALGTVCQASGNMAQTTSSVLEAMGRLPDPQRRMVLPVLAELATPAALEAAQAAARHADPEFVRRAMETLAQWPNGSAAPALFELARNTADLTQHARALQGCIAVAELETDAAKRLDLLQQALAAARRPEEQKKALGQIGQTATPAALEAAAACLTNASLLDEAALATVMIAEKLAATNPQLARDAAARVMALCKTREIAKRAWAIKGLSAAPGPFIQQWLISGPYHKAGAADALALFDIVFPPEKPGADAAWKAMPAADMAPLATVFPDQNNAVAYLKTHIVAPEEADAALLLGSDDGVKAWLNGVVVHTNNVDRGAKPDQDIAPIQLQRGTNVLLLKITQGGGGWGACARIVNADGKPIPGLSIETVGQGIPPAGPPTPKPAELAR